MDVNAPQEIHKSIRELTTMKSKLVYTFCLSLFLVSLQTITAHALVLNQVDDFQSFTLENWGGGTGIGGTAPVVVLSGGPSGVGDAYLQAGATVGKLGTTNSIQWKGDYLTAGVNAIQMDLNNAGPDPVEMRIMLVDRFGTSGGSFTSTNAIMLPASSGWQTVEFGLTAADLSYVGIQGNPIGGTGVLADTLAIQDRLLLRHDSGTASAPGIASLVSATLGIDNITALFNPVLGDMDDNGIVDTDDVAPFIQALVDPDQFAIDHSTVDADVIGNINGDGQFDLGDIALFQTLVNASTTATAESVPEPSSILLAAMLSFGFAAIRRRRRQG